MLLLIPFITYTTITRTYKSLRSGQALRSGTINYETSLISSFSNIKEKIEAIYS